MIIVVVTVDRCQVAARNLRDLAAGFAQILDLFGGQACLESAADDRDRCRNRAVFAYRFLNEHSCFHVFGIRHAVGNNRALKCYDGLAVCQCLLNFG